MSRAKRSVRWIALSSCVAAFLCAAVAAATVEIYPGPPGPGPLPGGATYQSTLYQVEVFEGAIPTADLAACTGNSTSGSYQPGGDVLKPGSKGYSILAEFVRRINAPPTPVPMVMHTAWTAPVAAPCFHSA